MITDRASDTGLSMMPPVSVQIKYDAVMAGLIALFHWLNGLDNAIYLPFFIAGILVIFRDSWRGETSWLQIWFWGGQIVTDLIPLILSSLRGHPDISDVIRICISATWLWMLFRYRPPPPRKRHPIKEASAAIRSMMERLREHVIPLPEPA